MTKTLVVHVGIEKTGSTSLQSTLLKNRSSIKKQGIHFIETGVASNHHYWTAKAMGFRYNKALMSEAEVEKIKKAYVTEISRSDADTFLMTSEHFDMNAIPESISCLKEWGHFDRVKVVLVARNQVDYLRSLHGEAIKWGSVADLQEFQRRLNNRDRLSYMHRHELWTKDSFSLKVVDFDDRSSDLTERVLSALGVNLELDQNSNKNDKKNVSPSFGFLEAVRLLNSAVPKEHRRKNFEKLMEIVSHKVPEMLERQSFCLPTSTYSVILGQQENNDQFAGIHGFNPETFLGGSLSERLKSYEQYDPIDSQKELAKLSTFLMSRL